MRVNFSIGNSAPYLVVFPARISHEDAEFRVRDRCRHDAGDQKRRRSYGIEAFA